MGRGEGPGRESGAKREEDSIGKMASEKKARKGRERLRVPTIRCRIKKIADPQVKGQRRNEM